jgi:hypothetical protein
VFDAAIADLLGALAEIKSGGFCAEGHDHKTDLAHGNGFLQDDRLKLGIAPRLHGVCEF